MTMKSVVVLEEINEGDVSDQKKNCEAMIAKASQAVNEAQGVPMVITLVFDRLAPGNWSGQTACACSALGAAMAIPHLISHLKSQIEGSDHLQKELDGALNWFSNLAGIIADEAGETSSPTETLN